MLAPARTVPGPQLDHAVERSCRQHLAIGGERHRVTDRMFQSLFAPGSKLPKYHARVVAPRCQGLTVGRKGKGPNFALVALESGSLLTGGRVPQLDGPIPTRRGQG